MNINATLAGQFLTIFILIVSLLSYFLGKRKTTTPKLAALIGAALSIIPPLGLIYLAVLVLKKDVEPVS